MELILLALAPSLLWWWALQRGSRETPHRSRLMARAFLWGVAACIPAAVLEIAIVSGEAPSALVSVVLVPVIEELAKLLATWKAVYADRRFDESGDGMVYAGAGALGFAFAENLGYFASFDTTVILARTVLSVPGHVLFSFFWGAPMGRLKTVEGSSRGPLYRGLFVACVFHACYNALAILRRDWLGIVILLLTITALQWHLVRRIVVLETSGAAPRGRSDAPVPEIAPRPAERLFGTLQSVRWSTVGLTVAVGLLSSGITVGVVPVLSRLLWKIPQGQVFVISGLAGLLGSGVLVALATKGPVVVEAGIGMGALGFVAGLGAIQAGSIWSGLVTALGSCAGLGLAGAFGGWLGESVRPVQYADLDLETSSDGMMPPSD